MRGLHWVWLRFIPTQCTITKNSAKNASINKNKNLWFNNERLRNGIANLDLRAVLAEKNVPLKTAETSWSRSSDLIFSFPLVVSENDGVVSAESMKTDIVSSEGQRKEILNSAA